MADRITLYRAPTTEADVGAIADWLHEPEFCGRHARTYGE